MNPNGAEAGSRPLRNNLRSAVLRYAIALAMLAIPAAVTLAFKNYPVLNPIISLSYLLAVAAAAWWAGATAGIVVSCLCIPLLTVTASGGSRILPPRFDPLGLAVLCFFSILVAAVANARRRIELLLRITNEELERKVKERTAELESSRNWWETTLASIGDAVIATDLEGRVTFMNQIAASLTGWTREDALNRPLVEVFSIINEFSKEYCDNPVKRVLAHGVVVGLANHTLLMSRDGREIPIDDSAAPIRAERGEIAGVVLIFRDVTERRQAEKVAEVARQSLERTNQELQQFAYAASHDLQEPLRNITIYTQLLAQRYRGKLDGDADKYIGFAVNGAARMEMLLKDLLAYTQASTLAEEEIRPTDLNAALHSVLSNLRATIAESGAIVTADTLPCVRISDIHAQQLFQNLIGNAIKYRDEEVPKIHISSCRNSKEWILGVADNGIGIDPQYKDRIFGLFKRLHNAEQYAGTGIGLAICQKLVQRYGGRIWVESELGTGSTFFFSIPFAS
ncbi:MAG TPA: ATP-binding protein [Chthoniobacterales bacterium]|nr:ATP-binding protein [Chthoniobacterales bacterium]